MKGMFTRMKKYSLFIFAVLLFISVCLPVKAEDHTSKDRRKIGDIDDFFADYALEAPPEPIYLPIVMYHQISQKKSKQGTYVISIDEFEKDLQLFKEQGFTTINVSELINFVTRKDELPEKPIMLTFDDGNLSDYVYALPLLKKYQMKAIFSIVGKFTDDYSEPDAIKNIDFAMLSWDEIREMHESGLADFQNHSYGMHDNSRRRGALPRKYESDEEYREIIKKDLGRLNAELKDHIGVEPEAFTCPFGCYSDRLREAVRNAGFSVIFTSHQIMNTLTGDPEELFNLKRFLRTHGKNMDELVKSWDQYYSK